MYKFDLKLLVIEIPELDKKKKELRMLRDLRRE